ncbi:MAG: hypothetical protein IKE94_09855 [Aeriscardovia sp.]|nr:hypothetical protein [Aeriscardovia sp.]
MKVYVDSESRIKAVDKTMDETLTELIIDDVNNPFADWSKAKICSYKCTVQDGVVTMFTPYRACSTLDYIDEIGHEADDNADKAEAFDIMIGGAEA